MPSNPTVIPGTFGADTSGLVRLGQALGQIFNPRDFALEEAMETFRDPVFMEKAATDLAAAQRRDELNPVIPSVGDLMKGSVPDTTPEVTQVQEAYMRAAGLDPNKREHVEAAHGILGVAFKSLPAAQRAQARLGAEEEFRKREEKIATTEQGTREKLSEAQQTEVTMHQEALNMGKSLGVHLTEVQQKALSNDLMIRALRMQNANEEQRKAILAEIPELAALYSVSPEAFAQGLIALLGADSGGGLDVNDLAVLQEKQQERDEKFLLKLQEASQLTGDEAMAALTMALQGRESYEQFGRLLPQSKFPAGYETYLAGWMRQSTRVQLMFSLPPDGTGFNADGWAEWINLIADAYDNATSDAERAEVREFMKSDPMWKVMTQSQKEQTVGQLKGLNVIFPELIFEFRALRAAREAEVAQQRARGFSQADVSDEIEARTGVRPIKDE